MFMNIFLLILYPIIERSSFDDSQKLFLDQRMDCFSVTDGCWDYLRNQHSRNHSDLCVLSEITVAAEGHGYNVKLELCFHDFMFFFFLNSC